MKIVVTGGAGFIGSNLVEHLAGLDHEVLIIDNFSTGREENISKVKNKIKIIEQDISIPGSWQNHLADCDRVFHIAALADIVPSIEKPKAYFDSNVSGTMNILLPLIDNKKVKLVYTASSSCYGLAEEIPTSEIAAKSPEYPYALTKLMGEQLIHHWSKVYGVHCVSARLFNVYGLKSRTSSSYGAMFGVFLAQVLKEQPLTIVGNGLQKRDFIYVDDVVSALCTLMTHGKKGENYNVGTGNPVTVLEIANKLSDKHVFIPSRPGEPHITHANIEKIKELGWRPKTDIDEGIKKLLDNIEYWDAAPVWDAKSIRKATQAWFDNLGNSYEKNT